MLAAVVRKEPYFDVVFCSYGVVCWLSDPEIRARHIAAILRSVAAASCLYSSQITVPKCNASPRFSAGIGKELEIELWHWSTSGYALVSCSLDCVYVRGFSGGVFSETRRSGGHKEKPEPLREEPGPLVYLLVTSYSTYYR
jgi:hypothetical protein